MIFEKIINAVLFFSIALALIGIGVMSADIIKGVIRELH